MKCEKCNKKHDGKFGSGRFCSRACANSHIPSNKHRLKTSLSLTGKKNTIKDIEGWKRSLSLAHLKRKEKRLAEILNLDFGDLSYGEKKFRIGHEQNGLCAICGISDQWNSKLLKFDLDHIDGNNKNNSRTNLRLVCPNCHSQTPTYKKNVGNKKVTDLDYKRALKKSSSIYEALKNLDVRMNGGAYRRARRIIKQFNIGGIV